MRAIGVMSSFGSALILVGTALLGTSAAAQERCTGFKWDVSRELALFDGAGTVLSIGKTASTAPKIVTNRLYRIDLAPQGDVAFGAQPGRVTATEGSYAGVAELLVNAPGNYRVAVDAPLWIDVVADGRLATVMDFQGQQTCDGPHKIVVFDLTAGQHFILQLSGSAKAAVRLSVTRAPTRTSSLEPWNSRAHSES